MYDQRYAGDSNLESERDNGQKEKRKQGEGITPTIHYLLPPLPSPPLPSLKQRLNVTSDKNFVNLVFT